MKLLQRIFERKTEPDVAVGYLTPGGDISVVRMMNPKDVENLKSDPSFRRSVEDLEMKTVGAEMVPIMKGSITKPLPAYVSNDYE